MEQSHQLYFFIGKGGVGKSTTSALFALGLAQQNRRALLVSMDPAHNQQEIWGRKLGRKPVKLHEYLAVQQVDVDYWVKQYLRQTEENLARRYNYHKAFAMKNYFHILRYSPGIEEYALTLAYGHVLQNAAPYAVVIFDMPPTALSLRFFSLPSLTLLWLEQLHRLRKEIYRKQEIVSKIKIGKQSLETDNILEKLETMQEQYTRMQARFAGKETHINLVLNADTLSLAEGLRIREKLQGLSLGLHRVIINKLAAGQAPWHIREEMAGEQFLGFPQYGGNLVGLEALKAYLAQYPDVLKDI